MATAVHPFTGEYELDPVHSTFQFAVRHVNVSTFRASFGDVEAHLSARNGALHLAASARVASISIAEPPEFREHVLAADFFAADDHPELAFRSTRIDLADDGIATVSGDLTIRGITRPVTASGTYEPPRQDPFGSFRTGFDLRAVIDRRAWGMDWQAQLPDESDAVGWDVEITVQLELIQS